MAQLNWIGLELIVWNIYVAVYKCIRDFIKRKYWSIPQLRYAYIIYTISMYLNLDFWLITEYSLKAIGVMIFFKFVTGFVLYVISRTFWKFQRFWIFSAEMEMVISTLAKQNVECVFRKVSCHGGLENFIRSHWLIATARVDTKNSISHGVNNRGNIGDLI